MNTVKRVKSSISALLACMLAGCTTYGAIENQSVVVTENHQGYSLENYQANTTRSDEITLVVAFSGGGSRASALSYGVMKALRDAEIEIDGKTERLIDQVDLITSVSGGSFTAAYYGLYGDQLFERFEDDFLRKDYVTEWIYGLASPLLWFSSQGRTDIATQLYESQLFRGATFADLQRRDAPLILLNATDLGGGIRFSFIQEYFDLLCSDISSYPIARAVTASSAVPIMLNPVVLKNHKGCINPAQNHLRNLDDDKLKSLSPHLTDTLRSLRSYENKDEREYIHLVDGGITDNLGLMAFYEMVELAGGIQPFMERIGTRPSERLVIISVNASAKPRYNIESTNEIPELEDTINAVTDTQLHRYNAATINLIRDSMERWSDELGSWWKPVDPFLIEVSFDGVQQEQRRLFLNQIPTSLSLSPEQADALIQAGEQLVKENPEFQRLIADF